MLKKIVGEKKLFLCPFLFFSWAQFCELLSFERVTDLKEVKIWAFIVSPFNNVDLISAVMFHSLFSCCHVSDGNQTCHTVQCG